MPSNYEKAYMDLVREVLIEGELRPTRNAPTFSTFGKLLKVDSALHSRFPILEGRKMFPKGVFGELAAFFKGPKTLKDFTDEGCNFWEMWGEDDGSIELDYGNVWRDFNGVDQLDAVLTSLSTDPHGRRHIISGWRPDRVDSLSLPCCHILYQWYVNNGGELEMIWYQRSVDLMVGLPSNVLSASAWNLMFADHLGLRPGKLTMMLGDVHIYEAHRKGAETYLAQAFDTPDDGVDFFYEDNLETFNKNSISLISYSPKPAINFELF